MIAVVPTGQEWFLPDLNPPDPNSTPRIRVFPAGASPRSEWSPPDLSCRIRVVPADLNHKESPKIY